MAAKTFYFKDAVPAGATLHRSLQDGGSAPTSATTTTGWNMGTNASGQMCIQNGGSEVARNTTGANGWGVTTQPASAPSQTIGDCWRSENTLAGTFLSTSAWSLNVILRSVTAAFTGRCRLAYRIWKSANANGTSATELTSGRFTSAATTASLTTASDTALNGSWSPGTAFTFTDEYLFVQVAFELTAVGGGTTQDAAIRVGVTTSLITPNFALAADVAEGSATAVDSTNATYSCNVTVVPNTANAASLTLTPTLEFTGTDAAAHDITYEVQIATDTVFGTSAPLDSYSETNSNVQFQLSSSVIRGGQSFNSGVGGTLDSVKFYLDRGASVSGNITATIYAHSGTFGSGGVPTGTALATSDPINSTTIATSPTALYTFTFSGANRITLAAASSYFVVAEYSGPSTVNLRIDNTSPTHAGNAAWHNGTVWANTVDDVIFYVYVAPTIVLDKFSNVDPGFVNTVSGGDTDPFTSGQKVSFTAQSALSAGTYYWRVWGQNPGTHSWSPWTTTRSFTAAPQTYNGAVAEGSATAADAPAASVPSGVTHNVSVAEGNRNYYTYTEAIGTSPPWGMGFNTVVPNAVTDPFGGTNADKVVATVTNVTHSFFHSASSFQPLLDSTVYTASIYAKAHAYIALYIAFIDKNNVTTTGAFDLLDGIVMGTSDPGANAAITDAGNGWYRCSISVNSGTGAGGSQGTVNFYPHSTAFYSGSGSNGMYFCGAQFEKGLLTPYLPVLAGPVAADTTSAGLVLNAAVAEGGNTATDAPDGVLVGVRVGRVAWIRLTTPKGAGNVFPVAVAEGTATALDTPSATEVNAAFIVEGSATATDALSATEVNAAFIVEGTATALDTPATTLNTSASVSEGGATALDTPNATEVDAASLAEGTPTALDTSATTAVFRPAVVEGTATALDAPSAVSSITAQIAEGTATAVDTPSVRTNFVVTHAEGAATATDTPSAASVIGASVAEGSPTATDVITADLNQSQSAALSEGGITAQDFPSAKSVYAASTVEGAATATDTCTTSAVITATDTEGTSTATDTPSVGAAVIPVVVAEVSATALDTPSAKAVYAASTVEGTATATDTPSAVASTGALVAEGSATSFDSPSAKGTFPAGVLEGTATALDTQQTIATFIANVAEGASTAVDVPIGTPVSPDLGVIAEGSATATDTPSAKAVWVSSVAEVSASAQDTPSATALWKASVAEVSVGLDTLSAGKATPAAVVEGSATAVATQSGDRQANADIAEISTALDTVSATSVYRSLVVEGGNTAFDLVVAFGDNEAFLREVASLHDTVSAQVPDRGADRTPYFQTRSTAYVFADPYRHFPVYIPVDTPQPGYVEEPEPEFEFTKPLVPSPKYTPLEKRVAKF